MKKLFILLIVFPAILLSCQKDFFEFKDILDEIGLKSAEGDRGDVACFEIQFPLTVIMPDGSLISGDTREELGSAVKEWHMNHRMDKKARITLQYPVTVTFQGKTLTLNNEKQLERVKMACKGGRDGMRDGDNDKVPCVELLFPRSYQMSDGIIITADDDAELKRKMTRWLEAHPDSRNRGTLVYPVEVKFKGRQITIENEQGMKRVKEACAADKGDGDKKVCFEIVFPLSFYMPDRSVITVNNAKDKDAVFKRWYNQHPRYSDQKPIMKFPIKIKYVTDRGDRIVDVRNSEALKKAYEDCGN